VTAVAPAGFAERVRSAARAGTLVVQPRMGFGTAAEMGAALAATRHARATTVGTITLDSYTRVGDLDGARRALAGGARLNGYPITVIDPATTADMIELGCGTGFPVQVRHGSARPEGIFRALVRLGITATEGGPVSYCLPYSRVPLAEAVRSWAWCCELLAGQSTGGRPHLESFGGCLLGQLCPPGLLVAVSVLEGMFFRQHGITDISLSLTQQTHAGQDLEALLALRRLAAEFLSDVDWHVVLYAYMGVYPRTRRGADALLAGAVRLAVRGGAARLIVKTRAEAYRIPTVAENVQALEFAAAVAGELPPGRAVAAEDTGVLAQARRLVEAVLELHSDVGVALIRAFRSGLLDVPYCLHEDNAGRARGALTDDGRLVWAATGRMPIRPVAGGAGEPVSSSALLAALRFVADRHDRAAATEVVAATGRTIGVAGQPG
jgi:methylaspartate mutase epsilon subunit